MRSTLFSAALLVSGAAFSAIPIDGWYTSVFGGYSFIPNHINQPFETHFIHDTSFVEGYNAGGRLGYQSHPLRYEAEYTYLHANTRFFRLEDIDQTGITGYAAANTVMANIYYDTPEVLPAIAPYLGLGIGYAYIQDSINSTGPFDPFCFHSSNSSFAYQGTVGLSYNFSENYAITLAYRYLATTTSNEFQDSFEAHMASVGAVYHFDQGEYK